MPYWEQRPGSTHTTSRWRKRTKMPRERKKLFCLFWSGKSHVSNIYDDALFLFNRSSFLKGKKEDLLVIIFGHQENRRRNRLRLLLLFFMAAQANLPPPPPQRRVLRPKSEAYGTFPSSSMWRWGGREEEKKPVAASPLLFSSLACGSSTVMPDTCIGGETAAVVVVVAAAERKERRGTGTVGDSFFKEPGFHLESFIFCGWRCGFFF